MFQLGVGDGCAQHVQALLENDVYVYPGQWANSRDGKVSSFLYYYILYWLTFLEPMWLTKSSQTEVQIYLNPGLIDSIKTAFFNGPTAFGYKYKEHFVSSHPDRKEPELTMSIVALGATAVRYLKKIEFLLTDLAKFFAVLWEWREGKKIKLNSEGQKSRGDKFEGDNFKKVYERHMDTLSALKMKINTYHRVMSTLYSKVV